MTRHGFARDFEFEILGKEDNKLKYMLTSNEQTLEKYSFHFELYVIYELKGQKLDVTYEVKNKDNKKMYFSIGAHPAFNCDISEGNKYIEFEHEETLDSYIINLQNGLIDKGKKPILKNQNQLLLTYDLFKQDVLVFDCIESDSICIRDDKINEKIKVTIKDFPYLGIWTPQAPFICFEPWYGIADTVDSNNRLEEKKHTGIKYRSNV